jgi:flagellar biosynthesis GTPase FlhF
MKLRAKNILNARLIALRALVLLLCVLLSTGATLPLRAQTALQKQQQLEAQQRQDQERQEQRERQQQEREEQQQRQQQEREQQQRAQQEQREREQQQREQQQQEHEQQQRAQQEHQEREQQQRQQQQQEREQQQRVQQQQQQEREQQQRQTSPVLQRRPLEQALPPTTSHSTIPAATTRTEPAPRSVAPLVVSPPTVPVSTVYTGTRRVAPTIESVPAHPAVHADPIALLPLHPSPRPDAAGVVVPATGIFPRIPPRTTVVVPGAIVQHGHVVAPRTTVVVAPVTVVQPVRVVPGHSVATVLALGNFAPLVSPPNTLLAQAQSQMMQAQATCAQADAFTRYVNGQAQSTQQLNQGLDQMLQTLASQTSDPNTQAALLSQVGQSNPIDDATQQQMQNLAASSEANCQTQTMLAQTSLSVAESQKAVPPSAPQLAQGYVASTQPQTAGQPASPGAVSRLQGTAQQSPAAVGVQPVRFSQSSAAVATPPRLATGAAQAGSTTGPFGLKATFSSQKLFDPGYVSFSFSTPTAWASSASIDPDMDGDGASGAWIAGDEQTAINNSSIVCATHSRHPNTCSVGNGGTYQVCRVPTGVKWVALAVSNDGTIDNWSYGEAIGADNQQGAEQSAIANCGKAGCQLVWSASLNCATGAVEPGFGSGGGGTSFAGNNSSTPTNPPAGTPPNGAATAPQKRTPCPQGAVCADPAI